MLIKKNNYRISVIIPSYKRGKILGRTLQKLAKCSPLPHEVIVVEQSPRINPLVKRALKKFSGRVRLIKMAAPQAQVARNQAAAVAKNDILLFLDDDIEPEQSLIRAHLINYKDPSIAAVGGFYLEPGEKESASLRPITWWRPLSAIEKISANYVSKVDSPLWPSCNGSIRKEVFMKIGGFDERFEYTFLDDTDLSVRLLRAGYRCIHDPAARLIHLKEPTGGNRPVRQEDEVIAPRARWGNWVYFFCMNWGVLGLGELFYRWRTHVFRRPYLLRPRKFLKAVSEFIGGSVLGLRMLRMGRRLAKFN